MDGSTIDLVFTFNLSTWFKEYDRINGSLEFQLRITNISTTDITIQLLNQNYYNTITVHEGKSVNISCASVTGYDVGKISVKLNRIIVAESDSNVVTYSFISDRQYNFKHLTCESDKIGSDSPIRVHLRVECPPKFVQENKNLKFVELYKPNAMSFLIYSNPEVEEIWIEAVAPCYTKNETIHDFIISETELLYSDFGNKGFIIGNEITFEFKILSTEYEKYKIWTKNRLGEDSFDFNIQAVEYDKNNKMDRTGLITSSSIATGLFIYITVLHICLTIRHRINRTRQGHIQDPLHFHTYEDIDSISFAAANTRGLVTDQERPMLPARTTNSPHNESTITSISNRPTVNVSTSSIVSHQDPQVNAARCSYNAETEICTSSMFPIGEIRNSDGSYDEVSVASTDDSLQTFQRRSHQDRNSSNVTSSVGLIVGDEK
ncbi:unnamed protein product [Mytilus edulis]|uniref:Uncharacterized protein n=1 Tax=Mytilus edulis TaxID=6550 RepID=A0A8S3UYA2_MYTED|nr:unnamed protein product [Mytilus edulis]